MRLSSCGEERGDDDDCESNNYGHGKSIVTSLPTAVWEYDAGAQ